MRRHHFIIACAILGALITACAHNQTSGEPAAASNVAAQNSETAKAGGASAEAQKAAQDKIQDSGQDSIQGAGQEEKQMPAARPVPPKIDTPQPAQLDPNVIDKANSVFEPVLLNDDKKAKMAYGRNHRFLPELLQLAFDLRFKNYEHALEVLPKTPLSEQRKNFWQGVISKKPLKLGKEVCAALAASESYPVASQSDTSSDEVAWIREVDQLLDKVSAGQKAPAPKSDELDKILGDLKCQEGDCAPIPQDLRPKILTDEFFDKLHNWKRRDTRFMESLYKNLVQWKLYKPYVNTKNIFRLWKSLKASDDDTRQAHFLHRFVSIGRDMRSESGLDRLIGDKILDDQNDLKFARRINRFNDDNALLTVVTTIDHELAGCNLDLGKPGKAALPDYSKKAAPSSQSGAGSGSND
jgi:hypothetical protein